jgi:uncharacterized protein (TIGR03437 family)
MLVAAPALAQSPPDLTALDGILDRASLELQTDIELVVLHGDTVVYRRKTEGRGGVGTLAIASASKWLAAATVQSMVDEGLLSWDDPAGLHLFYFRGDKAAITLRQLFSHTSGLRVEFECLQDRTRTMDNCVQTIAGAPLLYPPGTALHYGDAPLQVGGRVAETVSKRFWEDLFQQRIASLAGMRFTTFQPDGPTINPDVAAGAFSTTDDYLNFIRMLAAKGRWQGQRVLSRRGVDRMLADQMRGARIASSFYAANEALREGASRNRYGLGNWLEGAANGVSIANSSQGAFGVSPYIDRRRDLLFLAFLRDQSVRFNRYYYQIQDVLHAAFPAPAVEPRETFGEHTIQHAGAERKAYSYTPDACQAAGAQCPVLVAFHSQGSDARSFAQTAMLTTLAEREELILLLWEGLPSGEDAGGAGNGESSPAPAWNLASDFGELVENDARLAWESLRFLPAMPGADPERIYLLGFGQGADLAAMAACRYPDTFAAVVLVAPEGRLRKTGEDSTGMAVCHPMSQVPVMAWGAPASMDDPDIEPAPNQQVSFWAEHNQCTAQTKDLWRRESLTWSITAHSGCDAGASVQYVEAESPPGQWPPDGAELSWEFLRGYSSRVRMQKAVVQTNAASYERRRGALGSLASLFGKDFAPQTVAASGSELPTILGGVRVEIRDQEGTTRNAPLVFASPGQINLLIPEGLAAGIASVFVYRRLDLTHLDWLYLQPSAPGLFAADAGGSGAPAGEALYVLPNGSRRVLPLSTRQPQEGVSQSHPVYLGEPGAELYLSLYGTGFRGREPADVSVWLGATLLSPVYAGPQGAFAGLDQLNLRLDSIPAETKDALPGRAVPLTVCTPDGCSNRLELRFHSGVLPAP